MIGSQKQIESTETKTYSVKGYHSVRMILVLSSQRFSLPIRVSVGNVFSVIAIRSNKISSLKNVSPYVSLKGPLVRPYDICLHVSTCTFTQKFFSLLLSTFSINCYVRTILVSLPSVSLYVTSSQHFSVSRFADLLA